LFEVPICAENIIKEAGIRILFYDYEKFSNGEIEGQK
jgi:hypothetical protein